ncbi:CDP-alcohol phosphatidyltransferase family protein [Qipengyuania sp. RANM35]|uniref:CDP-alcohol phosphatidyltransferase family protein n=1 Tax=Qipengyuania sp. RANM35 TaxID=3068635 RepID=UPI0034DACD99
MSAPTPAAITFPSERAANCLVAGVPATARAVLQLAKVHGGENRQVIVAVPGGWSPSPLTVREIHRLAPGFELLAVDSCGLGERPLIGGNKLQTAGEVSPNAGDADVPTLQVLGRRIVASTGKPTDGIVSRHLNRPISQFITRLVLKFPAARPWHATFAAGLLGIAMFVALISGGSQGLLLGAALFQLSSIVDGVDGEMARATFRSSAAGAMMDSLTDTATNLCFVGGVSFNLFTAGEETAGLAGLAGGIILALGSAILAIQSRRDGGDLTFDALKTRFGQRPSAVRRWLTYITMRDFYAFAAFLAIVAGLATALLYVFLVVAIGWFVVLCWTLLTTSTSVRQG